MSLLHDDQNKMQGAKRGKVGVFLTSRQISWILSSFVFVAFFVFIAGYFLGKKKAVEKFYHRVSQDSLADQIYYSVCSMYENKDVSTQSESTEDMPNDELAEKDAIEQDSPDISTAVDAQVAEDSAICDAKIETSAEEIAIKKYYAELIGFGTLRAANRFENRLKKQDFSVMVKKRRSKTARGRTITWYQVVTETFDNKNDLIAFVDIIKEKERLKGVRIVQC